MPDPTENTRRAARMIDGPFRLEADSRAEGLERGLEARIADPLWMLGRQWQVGELRGEDAGSPILARSVLEIAKVTPPGADDGRPLEAAIEAEAPGAGAYGLAVDAGLRLKAALFAADPSAAALWSALRARFPLDARGDSPPSPPVELRIRARRSLDGLAAARAIRAEGFPAEAHGPLRRALGDWAALAEPWIEGAGDAWVPEQLCYHTSLTTGSPPTGAPVVQLRRYRGDRIDWYSGDLVGAPSAAKSPPTTAVPSSVRYPGMPSNRWWEVEASGVHWLDVEGEMSESIRLMVAEFATVFGDDWFVVPAGPVPYGSLARVADLKVRDVFGIEARIQSLAALDGSERVWRMFEVTDTSSSAGGGPLGDPWVHLANATGDVLFSDPLEDVHFVRDEAANLGWAVERVVEGCDGKGEARARTPEPQVEGAGWAWSALGAIPPGWVPLIPQVKNGQVRAHRGRLPGWGANDGAHGAILRTPGGLCWDEAELPSSGLSVQRLWQRCRGARGEVLLWIGRRRALTPAGPGPGLQFDHLRR